MKAIILSVGDELALGQTVDTNSAWISARLAENGITPAKHVTVADDLNAIVDAIKWATPACDVLIISGGIGPTEDDLTRQAVAAAMGVELKLEPAALENVERFFKALRREMPEKNRVQALIPVGAKMIENNNGTAPGIKGQLRHAGHARLAAPPTTALYVVPGVPKEMKAMFEKSILPELKEKAGGRAVRSMTIHTFGAGESTVAEKLGDLMRRDRNPSVGTTVSNGYVSVRVNSYFESSEKAASELQATADQVQSMLGDLVWGTDNQTLEELVAGLLIKRNLTVATAESCTGGLLAKMLTDIPGSSAYYERGWVTYSNDSKVNSLGIELEILEEFGAVSEQVAEAMAIEAYLHGGANCALGITGIAGPAGGTQEKPVGTVCIGIYMEGAEPMVETRRFIFHGDREMIRDRSAKMALSMLRFKLLGRAMPF